MISSVSCAVVSTFFPSLILPCLILPVVFTYHVFVLPLLLVLILLLPLQWLLLCLQAAALVLQHQASACLAAVCVWRLKALTSESAASHTLAHTQTNKKAHTHTHTHTHTLRSDVSAVGRGEEIFDLLKCSHMTSYCDGHNKYLNDANTVLQKLNFQIVAFTTTKILFCHFHLIFLTQDARVYTLCVGLFLCLHCDSIFLKQSDEHVKTETDWV